MEASGSPTWVQMKVKVMNMIKAGDQRREQPPMALVNDPLFHILPRRRPEPVDVSPIAERKMAFSPPPDQCKSKKKDEAEKSSFSTSSQVLPRRRLKMMEPAKALALLTNLIIVGSCTFTLLFQGSKCVERYFEADTKAILKGKKTKASSFD